ncbi:MAG: hypothetical protein EPO21_20525 [Chloroflexota bacterium]|nr:MAG: hypothetical protein EPO21_20525 [Chloroflexota bacterium]
MKRLPSDLLTLRVGLGVGDVIALMLAVWLSSGLHYGFEAGLGPQSWTRLALIPIVLVALWLQHLYDEEYLLGGVREYSKAVTACTYGALALVALSFIFGGSPMISREWLVVNWLLSAFLVCLWRFGARRMAYQLRKRGHLVTSLIVVGASDQGAAIAQQLDAPSSCGSRVIGFLDDYLPTGAVVTTTRRHRGGDLSLLRVLGSPENLRQIAQRHGVREVIVIPHALSWESFESIVRQVALSDGQLRVRVTPGLYDAMATSVRALPRRGVPLLALEKARIRGVDRVLKAALDRGLTAAVLLALSPVLAAIVFIGRVQHSPLFERRLVLGLGGQPRPLYLFGPWLSKHVLLHGLPALVGVLRGHLSLVGPRPRLVSTAQHGSGEPGILLAMKPGLTGLWRLDAGDNMQPIWDGDLWYVRNYSIWEDVRILFETLVRINRSMRKDDSKIGRWQIEPPTEERSGEGRIRTGVGDSASMVVLSEPSGRA